jgi:hypothetical protein
MLCHSTVPSGNQIKSPTFSCSNWGDMPDGQCWSRNSKGRVFCVSSITTNHCVLKKLCVRMVVATFSSWNIPFESSVNSYQVNQVHLSTPHFLNSMPIQFTDFAQLCKRLLSDPFPSSEATKQSFWTQTSTTNVTIVPRITLDVWGKSKPRTKTFPPNGQMSLLIYFKRWLKAWKFHPSTVTTLLSICWVLVTECSRLKRVSTEVNDRACMWEAGIQHFLKVNCIAETQAHKPRPIVTT